MATRSGHPRLDALIEAYLARGTYRQLDAYEPDGYQIDFALADLAEPHHAESMCSDVAHDFAQFLIANGIPADDVSSEPGSVQEFGYQDATREGHPNHEVPQITVGEEHYMVDWTAAQYGYGEFPMVQKMDWGRYRASGGTAGWVR